MSIRFSMIRDINGYNGFGLPVSPDKYSATITAVGGEQTLTVAGEFSEWLVIFSFEPGTTVWVALNATAAVPAGATFAATTSEMNPTARKVKVGDVLHFITADTNADVGVILYGLI